MGFILGSSFRQASEGKAEATGFLFVGPWFIHSRLEAFDGGWASSLLTCGSWSWTMTTRIVRSSSSVVGYLFFLE